MAGLVYGDQRIPFGGINDEGDDFDSKPGSLDPSSYNVIPNRSFSSLMSRGGFVSPIDLPSVGNGLKTGMSISKILHVDKFRVTKPTEKTITVLVALCTFTPSGGVPVYMIRIFMNPSFSGGSFGGSTTWQEKEIWYIDDVRTNATITMSTGPDRYFPTINIPSNGGYFPSDFDNAYLYLEDAFTSPVNHNAEGDKITANASMDYNQGTGGMRVYLESTHAAGVFDRVGIDFQRIHKNLETGKIPYNDLCSTSSTFFDAYSFETEQVDEKIILSVHTGDTGRAPFTLALGYVSKTFFSTGRIYSKADYIYDGGDTLYDKRLVYGFPGYDNINKSNVATVFDGKTVRRWVAARADMTDGSSASTATVTATGGYDKIMGKLTVGAGFVGGNTTNDIYCIEGCDVSIIVNDFVIAEWDVHGRMGAYKEFETHSALIGGEFKRINDNSQSYIDNFPEFPVLGCNSGMIKSGNEISWPNGIISKIAVTNPTGNSGYSDTSRIDVTSTNVSNSVGTKAVVALDQVQFDQHERESQIASLKKQLKNVNEGILLGNTSGYHEVKRIKKQIQLIQNRVFAGVIKDIAVLYGGDGYDSASVTLTISGYTPGVAITTSITVDRSMFYDYIVPIYDGYRRGLHFNGKKRLGATTSASLVLYNVLGCEVMIPVSFNRNITGFDYVLSANNNESTSSKHTLLEYLDAHTVFNDNMSTGYDYRLYFDLHAGDSNQYGYVYTKVTRVDKSKFDTTDIGGNHLFLTGNPAFSFNPDLNTDNPNYYAILFGGSGSSKMKKDYGFGNKSLTFLRDRMFACDSKYSEYQLGVIQDSVQEAKHTVFFSPIPQFGGNFHQFNSSGLQIPTREAGKAVAVVPVSTMRRDDQNQQTNNLLILCDRGYIYVDLTNNDEANFYPYYNQGVSCVSRKSVTKYNGKAFWAGENDVYMWDGSQAVPITRLGDSSINKTWRSIPIANKRLSVGVFNEDRKQYWLFVVGNDSVGWIYLFDFTLNNIYKFKDPNNIAPVSAGFMDGKIWSVYKSNLDYVEYIESATTDTHTGGSVFPPGATNYSVNLVFNNIKGSERMSILKGVALTYTGSPNVIPIVDGRQGTGLLAAGGQTKAYLERKINDSGFGSYNNRGRRYSVLMTQASGYFELFDLTLNIDPNVPQDSLIGGLT